MLIQVTGNMRIALSNSVWGMRDFLTSARQWLRVVGMNDRDVILLKGDSDEDL